MSKSTDRLNREVIAYARKRASVLTAQAGKSLQKLENEKVHWRPKSGSHCKSQKMSKSTDNPIQGVIALT